MPTNPNEPSSHRTTVRRGTKRASYDPHDIRGILAWGLVAHVAVNTTDGPLALPMVYGISGDTMYLHGALANSILKAGGDADVCATVTIVDGMVFAKTAFNHSMNYRSVVVRGQGRVVTDEAEHLEALRVITDHVVETWESTRPASTAELRATRVIALSINEASAKVRTGGAVNEPDDADQPYWSGHVPLTLVFGTPVTNDDSSAPIPPQIADLDGRDAHS